LDGNTPLHEWKYDTKDRPKLGVDEFGQVTKDKPEPVENLITWIFDEGTFRPAAKIEGDKRYSIINDYLGTPKETYDSWGNKIWDIELEAYGKVRTCSGDKSFIPFRFQGQYHDVETGLYYNRFRYYSPEEGMYVTAQDPIGLEAGHQLYGYVVDPHSKIDPFGQVGEDVDWGAYLKKLTGTSPPSSMVNPHAHHIVFKNGRGTAMKKVLAESKAILEKHGIDWLKGKENLVWAPNKNYSLKAAEAVRDALQEAEQLHGTKAAIINTLKLLGDKFANDTICS